jgi:hypothetical protein
MLRISSVLIANLGSKSMTISVLITSKTVRGNKTIVTKVLLNTGAGGLFLDKKYANKHEIILYKLPNLITPRNIDGMLNQAGQITHYTWIRFRSTKESGKTFNHKLGIFGHHFWFALVYKK